MNVNLDLLDALSPENSIRMLYDEAIQKPQQGQHDNLNKRMRFYLMHQLARQASLRNPHLDLVECGSWFGHSSYITATLMAQCKSAGRLHVFDSFEGLSEFKPPDRSGHWTTDEQRAEVRAWFRSDLERVRQFLAPFESVELYPGWIPDRFADLAPSKLGFVSIDVDLYEPTRDCIGFFYPRLVDRGIMYFDDYGYRDFPGAKWAVDEYLQEHVPAFFIDGPAGSAFAIK